MTMQIKLWADYGCWPIWSLDEPDNIEPSELPLTHETIGRLEKWQDTYDATLNQEYPPLSAFASPEAEQTFQQEGIKLWLQLRQELSPEYEVFYKIGDRLLKHPEELALPKAEDLLEISQAEVIALRDIHTNKLIRNAQGDPVFLVPLQNEYGKVLKTSQDLPIYPTPVRNPQNQEYVFDAKGNIVVCPILRDDRGAIVEYQGIPQFHPPAYQVQNDRLYLKQDEKGNYIFCEAERDKNGKILRNSSGQPIFKNFLPRVLQI